MVSNKTQRVVVIGAGFGGLYACRELLKGRANLRVTLIDRRNFHLFQPLLYQVAGGQLSPADIAYPIRSIFAGERRITIIQDHVKKVRLDERVVELSDQDIEYDRLIISAGMANAYFGNKHWEAHAPGLKSIEDALRIRKLIFNTFEQAERLANKGQGRKKIQFAIIGGGPTGIELSGALARISRRMLRNEYHNIQPEDTDIFLIEGSPRILSDFPSSLVQATELALERLGITLLKHTMVDDVGPGFLKLKTGDEIKTLPADVIIWSAGVRAVFDRTRIVSGKPLTFDRGGRIAVDDHCRIPHYDEVFVIGDGARFDSGGGNILPGVAPVAMQQGRYVARVIKAGLYQNLARPFRYKNKGSLAVIGRNAAVASFGRIRVSGFPAWVLWIFVHIGYLIGYRNKLLVLIQWAWSYISDKPSARLILDYIPDKSDQ